MSDALTAAVGLRDLLRNKPASVLERLAAALFSQLLDVSFSVAASGFQRGADAGTAAEQNRHIRIEAKRYGDGSTLSERELLGELDQAIADAPELEAWVLVATRAAPEQLQTALRRKGEGNGVPVIILDWPDDRVAPFSVLCATHIDLVRRFVPEAASVNDLGSLRAASDQVIGALRRDLSSWALGMEALRDASHLRLLSVWEDRAASQALLGQDAAGAARPDFVRREAVFAALRSWWDSSRPGPVMVHGRDGVGKTWAVLDWLQDNRKGLPPVIVAPSSAAAAIGGRSAVEVRTFLADQLMEIAPVRDRQYWLRRLDRLLARPVEEGPALVLLVDGLNQDTTVAWDALFEALQGDAFRGKVRVLATTRTSHLVDRLRRFRDLVISPVQFELAPLGTESGGELDRALAVHGLALSDLHPDLIQMAAVPRLLSLVLRFKEKLGTPGQVTPDRLLWEYGRDTFGRRGGKSFSEEDWHDWLREVASKARRGIVSFRHRQLGEMIQRPDLGSEEVRARLDDIADNRFAERNSAGEWVLSAGIVRHALGAALLADLRSAAEGGHQTPSALLDAWLDPLAGLDQRADVLRSAASILIEQGEGIDGPIGCALVTAWLQSQNLPDSHRSEILGLAEPLYIPLLAAAESSRTPGSRSARHWALEALCGIPRSAGPTWDVILGRVRQWFLTVPRDAARRARSVEHDKACGERLTKRIGMDRPGDVLVAGTKVTIVDDGDDELLELAPYLLRGGPLKPALSTLEAAAIHLAVRGMVPGWDGLTWICLGNELDAADMASGLRAASLRIAAQPLEGGVSPQMLARLRALLLYLTGYEDDEREGLRIDGPGEWHPVYAEYLRDPARSLVALERRHVAAVLDDATIAPRLMAERIGAFWCDPETPVPVAFAPAAAAVADAIDATKLGSSQGRSWEDHQVERMEPALARAAPAALANLNRRLLLSMGTALPEARAPKAWRALKAMFVAGPEHSAAARALRLSGKDLNANQEAMTAGLLLVIETLPLSAREQFASIIEADLQWLPMDLQAVLRAPSPEDLAALVASYGDRPKRKRTLVQLLSIAPDGSAIAVREWLEGLTADGDDGVRCAAFEILCRVDLRGFGGRLDHDGWAWADATLVLESHHGSKALASAASDRPFKSLSERIAPWLLLDVARDRGSRAEEVRCAASILTRCLVSAIPEVPDLGCDLSVNLREGRGDLPTISLSDRDAADVANLRRTPSEITGAGNASDEVFERAVERIRGARARGLDLYLMPVEPSDLALAVEHAPDEVARWVDGCGECGDAFVRRVRSAESFYVSLCEALLASDPDRGATLWRAVRQSLNVRFKGMAAIDEMIHIAFRASGSPAVRAMRDEVLAEALNDAALAEVATAAVLNGASDWLAAQIDEGMASSVRWLQRRAIVLSGFLAAPSQRVASDCSDRPTSCEELERTAAEARRKAVSARHWWDEFVGATSADDALAAWLLFLRVADRRVFDWLQLCGSDQVAGLDGRKAAFARINAREVETACARASESSRDKLFGKRVVRGLVGMSPALSRSDLP